MEPRAGPIYEVSCFVDADGAEAFAQTVEELAATARRHSDILEVLVLERAADAANDQRSWLLEFVLRDDARLDELVAAGVVPDAGSAGANFGDSVQVVTRLLSETPLPANRPADRYTDCLNCGAVLTGQYCGQCGQRASSRLISLWELVTDAFGDLFELDSRLWRTLIPLVVRPGRLTHDYLEGRRARFMPPFRMYLVLSLVFFLVAFTDPREKLGILFESPAAAPGPAAAAQDGAPAEVTNPAEADALRRQILAELERGPEADTGAGAADDFEIQLGTGSESDIRCDIDDADFDELPEFLARRLTVERMQRVCEQLQIDDGRSFADGVINAIPTALIVLLPVLAFVLAALYPLSRRYYVEHLLFLVHFHAFFFLLLTLQILFARAATWVGLPEAVRVLTLVATSLYVPVYLFVAMRRVYGQGRLVTFLKFVVLTTAYLVGFTMTMLTVAIFVAFSL